MANYRFYDVFEPKEFQDFVRDIVQIRENIKLENFGDSRDGGMDGRFICSKGEFTVLQVKRYKAYSKTSLQQELNKVNEIKPDRYILALSYDAEPDTKDKIKEMFKPYIKNTSDIVLNADFNDYLGDVSGK
ncbi:MAG: restriction endonuclease [Clostridium sp.]|nr:restriction endonuclease [Clostridium sp.]